jgi:predicted permease
MSWLRFFHRKKWDAERARELNSYLEIETSENISRGMTSDDAKYAALRKLGNQTLIREEIYHMNSIGFLESFWHDLRFALRMLRKSPAFSLVIVLSLALGTGANTAIFTLVDAALLRLLPVKNPEQLVTLSPVDSSGDSYPTFSYPAYLEFRDRNEVFSGVFTFDNFGKADLGVDGHGGLATLEFVSGNYFSVLGVNAAQGRTISPEDDRASGGSAVAVISDSYWTSRFNRDPSVVGKGVTINNSPYTIVGVTPPEFFGMQPGASIGVWVPVTTANLVRPDFAMAGTPNDILSAPNRNWLPIFARLQSSITLDRAASNVAVIFDHVKQIRIKDPRYSAEARKEILETSVQLEPGSRGLNLLRGRFSKPLSILMAVVGLLLLISCANVANLLLARATARQREFGVRVALGAGRARLIRQLMTESVLLALGGGALGLLIAFWGSKSLLVLMSPGTLPIPLNVQPDLRVLAFTLLISLFAAVLFGLAPAWRAARVDLSAGLKESARSLGGARAGVRLGRVLVVSQVSLSLILLIGAGLLVRSLGNLKNIYPGFDENNTLLLSINPSLVGYKGEQHMALFRRLLERVRSTPGVQAASFSLLTPITPGAIKSFLKVQGETVTPTENQLVELNYVGPDYFATIGMPIVLGRGLTISDDLTTPNVVVINQSFARTYFGDSNPIGRRFSSDTPLIREIVGVVQDAKYHDPRDTNRPAAYVPYFQVGNSGVMTFEIRTSMDPTSIVPSVRREIEAVDSRLPIFGESTLIRQVNQSFVQERLVASLTSLFGLLALLLAAVGLYGLMAYSVTRRTSEIGVRVALGAQRGDISWMVLRETFLLVVIGLAIGIPGSLAASRLIASELYNVHPSDPLTIAAATLVMVGVALFAGFLPARRASRVDPMVALRYE